MPDCSVCHKTLTDLETFGPVSYPLCWDHWWEYIQGELDPEPKEGLSSTDMNSGQLGFAP